MERNLVYALQMSTWLSGINVCQSLFMYNVSDLKNKAVAFKTLCMCVVKYNYTMGKVQLCFSDKSQVCMWLICYVAQMRYCETSCSEESRNTPHDQFPLFVPQCQCLPIFLVVQEVLSLHPILVLLSVPLETDQRMQVLPFHPFHQKVLENLWGLALLVTQKFQEVPESQPEHHKL